MNTNETQSLVPSVRYYASGLIGKPGDYRVDIMREITTANTVTNGLYACIECSRVPDDMLAEADHLVAKLNSYATLFAKNQELREALAGLLALPILKTVDGMQGAHFSSLVRAVSDAKAALE